MENTASNIVAPTKEKVLFAKKTYYTRKRRKFSKQFKIEAVEAVIRGEKRYQDFVGKDGRAIDPGNVQVWESKYLAGQLKTRGKLLAKPTMESVVTSKPAQQNLPIENQSISILLKEMLTSFVEQNTKLAIENVQLRGQVRVQPELLNRRKSDMNQGVRVG